MVGNLTHFVNRIPDRTQPRWLETGLPFVHFFFQKASQVGGVLPQRRLGPRALRGHPRGVFERP